MRPCLGWAEEPTSRSEWLGEDFLRAADLHTHAHAHALTHTLLPAAMEQSWGAHKNVRLPLMETAEGPLGTVSCRNSARSRSNWCGFLDHPVVLWIDAVSAVYGDVLSQ